MITEFYQRVKDTMPEGIERKVLDVLSSHVGEENKIDLGRLTVAVTGADTVTTERQVREAIEMLRLRHVPVLSNSGTAGRWLAANRDEIATALNDLYARRDSLNRIIRGLETVQLPDETKVQMELF